MAAVDPGRLCVLEQADNLRDWLHLALPQVRQGAQAFGARVRQSLSVEILLLMQCAHWPSLVTTVSPLVGAW